MRKRIVIRQSCCDRLTKAIDAYIRKADNNLSDQLGKEGYAKPKKTLQYAESIEDDVADILTEETDYFVREAKTSGSLEDFQKKLPAVTAATPATAKLSKTFATQLKRFMPEYAAYYLKKTDKSLKLDRVSKRTTAWIESWSDDLADLMKTTSKAQLESLLKKEINNGGNISQFCVDLINSGMEKEGKGEYWTSHYRARRVAVTEVLRAHSVAQQEAFMQSPAVEEKSWLHTGNYRNEPRQNHIDMSGQTVPKGQPFELIGEDGIVYHPMYPRDVSLPAGESINCHCIQQPVVSEDILGLPLEERQKLQQQAIDEMDDDWEAELDARNKAKAGIEDE
ncbi:phage minor head protein [Faecalibacterium duncaniae]|nr:MAG TPA: minor head component F [Caudoviricetes sp.]